MSACRKSLFDTLRHFSDLQKALKNADHHRAGHPSRVSRTHPSAPLTSPAARRRRNPNPSPPSWGGAAGRSPQGGAPFQRRPQAARHQTPVARAASCRLARALGRVRGRGASGPPSGGRGQPKENHGRAPDRGPPPPRRRAAGGPPPGEVGLGAGGARTQARPPTPRPGGRSQRPGHRPTAERPGGGAAAPRTQAASNETGRRPTTGRGPRRQPPANTNGGEGPRAGAGQGRAAAIGAGAAGPGQYRPGLHPTGRIPFMFAPAGQTAPQGREPRTGTAGRRALRPAAWRHGRREVRTEAGAIPPGRGAAWRQKNAGRLAPPAGHDWTKKMRGGRFVPPACRYSGYQISPCSA